MITRSGYPMIVNINTATIGIKNNLMAISRYTLPLGDNNIELIIGQSYLGDLMPAHIIYRFHDNRQTLLMRLCETHKFRPDAKFGSGTVPDLIPVTKRYAVSGHQCMGIFDFARKNVHTR